MFFCQLQKSVSTAYRMSCKLSQRTDLDFQHSQSHSLIEDLSNVEAAHWFNHGAAMLKLCRFHNTDEYDIEYVDEYHWQFCDKQCGALHQSRHSKGGSTFR